MTKHTRGPWKAVAGQVKAVNSIGMMAKMTDYPEALADSKLMAAAPDMLEALEIALEQGDFQPKVKEIIVNTINKAKGVI